MLPSLITLLPRSLRLGACERIISSFKRGHYGYTNFSPPLLKSTSNATVFEHFSGKLCLNFLTLLLSKGKDKGTGQRVQAHIV